ncbi:ROK family protein [Sediminitomix flava]|uniref:Glucokinase n=1 Tax=Sediminitomix flava TaxID=379075 RepID=A0A315ZUH1_SEDFL|nr:ROK family protein [Sediminitomix flava]PWJ39289.1 glucokinase [Sediminitomix flava]
MKKVAIGIDIGGTNTVIGVVDQEGSVLAKGNIPTGKHMDVNLYLDDMQAEINRVLDFINEEIEVMGIGLGAPNGNYYSGAIEFAPNLNWKGRVELVNLLKERFEYPIITLTNDANAAAIGEMIYGEAKEMKNFIMITLGTGLGSGIVVNGEMVYGHDGFAGELGHVRVEKNGRECGCGRRGCLETYCSATGLVNTVYELIGTSKLPSVLREKVHQGEVTSKMVFDAATDGDELAKEAFRYTAEKLGTALADFMTFSSPEAFILFGGLANAGDLLLKPTYEYMEENMLSCFKGKVKLIQSGLPGADAAVLGSSSLVWQELNKEVLA